MKKPLVVGIGELLWDLLPSGRQLGGAPANFAWFASALGARSCIVSAVGRDREGRDILSRLKKMGLSRRYIARDSARPTGLVAVALDRDGKPEYDIRRNAAWDFIRMTPELRALAGRADAVCFGSLAQRSPASRAAIRCFLSHVPARALRVFDINLRQSFYSRATVEALLGLANIFKLNDEELVTVARMLRLRGGEQEVAASLMRRFRLEAVSLTRGSRGAVLYCREGAFEAAALAPRVVDTVGAGDSFAAAIVMGFLNGAGRQATVESANRLAAFVCGQRGATPVLARTVLKDLRPIARRKK